jgi:hypothetical protein
MNTLMWAMILTSLALNLRVLYPAKKRAYEVTYQMPKSGVHRFDVFMTRWEAWTFRRSVKGNRFDTKLTLKR